MEAYLVFTLSIFLLISGVVDSSGSKLVSVKEDESVTLNADVIKKQSEEILWYFEDTLIAQISGDPRKSCLYEGEGGIFRDRLKVDYKTGSLKIINIRAEHRGRFEANLIKSLGGSEDLNQKKTCDRTDIIRKMSSNGDNITTTFIVSVSTSLSGPDKTSERLYNIHTDQDCSRKPVLISLLFGSVVGAAVVLLLAAVIVAFFVMCQRCRNSREDMEKNKTEILLKDKV